MCVKKLLIQINLLDFIQTNMIIKEVNFLLTVDDDFGFFSGNDIKRYNFSKYNVEQNFICKDYFVNN